MFFAKEFHIEAYSIKPPSTVISVCTHVFLFCLHQISSSCSLTLPPQLQKLSFHVMKNEREKEAPADKYTATLKYSLIYTQSLTTFDFNKNANI